MRNFKAKKYDGTTLTWLGDSLMYYGELRFCDLKIKAILIYFDNINLQFKNKNSSSSFW